MTTNLEHLVQQCTDELHDRGYHPYHINRLINAWEGIVHWFSNHHINHFDKETAFAYCHEELGSHIIVKGMTSAQKRQLHALRMLLSYLEDGDFEFRTPSVEYTFLGETGKIIHAYLQHEISRGLSNRTIENKRLALYQFNQFLLNKHFDFNDLNIDKIEAYFSCTTKGSLALRHTHATHLRQLFHYLYEQGITATNHAFFVLKDQYKSRCKLPTNYTEAEVARILRSVNRSSAIGKRDYLVLLLAAEYGWRAGDIVRFKFKQIDWDKNTISFNQEKTDTPVEFPLLASVGNAIIDYTKHARPVSDTPEVIVAMDAANKGKPLKETTLHSIVSRYMCEANIEHWQQKKHGPHSLRHSLATNMLKNNIAMPVIRTVLGHQRTETTQIYLKVDIDKLRLCALPMPSITSLEYKEVLA